MAKYRISGKHYTKKSILGISLIVVLVVAAASIAVAAAILPGMVEGHEGSDRVTEGGYRRPDVEAIVLDNNGQISINADLEQVFVTVKYSDGSSEKVALSELVVEGLDTSVEGAVENVVLDFGGFKQTVTYTVVPTTLTVEYVASTGGRIDGETLQHVTAGADATRVEAIPNEGYYFDEWSDGYSSASRMDTKISKSTKLIAVFRKMNYTVVFYYPDGTTAREEIVPYGQSPTRVPRPDEHNMQLYGYTFVGWDTDYSSITRDTNIYPIFEKNAADLYLECTTDKTGAALGSVSDLMPYYPKGTEAVLRIKANAGRIFVGWSVRNADGEWVRLAIKDDEAVIELAADNYVSFKTSQTGTSEEYVLAFTPPEDNDLRASVNEIYIKADFVYVESEITFSSMSAPVFSPILLPYGTPIGEVFDVEDTDKLSATGYYFKGWYDANNPYNDDGTPAIIDNDTVFAQPTELVAYWEKRIFLAVFLKGENEDTSFTDPSSGYDAELGGRVLEVYYQDSLAGALSGAFPETAPVKTNYTFKGWYLADEFMQPTDYVIDRNYKIDREIAYIIPVFEVNTRKLITNIEGSGNIYSLVYNDQYGEYEEIAVTGIVSMPVTDDFVIRIRPGKDYGIMSAELNGEDILSGLTDAGEYYDLVIPAVISSDYYLHVVFSLSQYEIAVVNGSSLASGSVTYNVAGASETQKVTESDVNFSFRVDDGVSVNLEISAPADHYIATVAVNGTVRSVPQGAVYYTLVLDRVYSDCVVSVVYNETTYNVTLPDRSSLTNGSMEAAGSVTQYNGGESPVFYVEANEGYYIRGLRANGTIVDPYFTDTDYTVEDILVNGEAVTGDDVYDYRVTSYTLTVNSIYRDIVFEVEFAPIYYYVNTYAEGVGSVTAGSIVDYGTTANVIATTVTEYYVSAVTVNGEKMTYSDKSSSRVYTVASVKKDYEIVFTFERSTHVVTFLSDTGALDNDAAILYNGISYPYGTSGQTFADISTGTNAEFTVNAPEGYYIEQILLKSVSDGSSSAETIGYGASSHTLRFDNISADYEVEVMFAYINLDFTVYLLGQSDSGVSMTVNGTPVSGNDDIIVYDGSLIYGSTMDIVFALGSSTLSVDNVTVVNREGTSYYYEAVSGAFVPSPSRGQYALVANTLSISDVDTEVDVYVRVEPSGWGTTSEVTVASSGNGVLESSHTGSVPQGTEVTFTAIPDPGYELKALIVNGKTVSYEGGSYTLTVERDTAVFAVFEETEFTVIVAGVSHGIVNTTLTRVTEGTSFGIRFIPATGYELTTFGLTIGDKAYRPDYTVGASGVVDYTVPGEYVTDDVVIEAVFSPVKYTVTVEYSGNGTVDGAYSGETLTIDYGTVFSLDLNAYEGHYISTIDVGGLGIAPSSLIGAAIDSDTNNFVSGILSTEITGDTHINIVFAPNAYRVTVAESVGGVTYVKKISADGSSTAYVDARTITFGAGDTLWLKMSAEDGYHLSELRVNGEVRNEWFDSSVNVNDFSEVYFEAAVIEGNVTLRVTYAVNEYSITVNAANKSLNFADYDTAPTSYGTVSLSGYTADANNVYTGINHGANVKITVTPRTARGYYISLFEIVYGDGSNTTVNLTSDINPDGGSYILQGISSDILALNVEFRRRTYSFEGALTVESLGSPFACTSDISVSFSNPYAAGATVLTDDGKYEFGLSYTVNVNPGTGYERVSFTVNGEDRSAAVRSHNYSAIISADTVVATQYRILVYSVSYGGNAGGSYLIRNELGDLVWKEGITVIDVDAAPPAAGEFVRAEQQTLSGMIWIDKTTGEITATYNTVFVFVASPEDYNGYGISKFTVNNGGYTIVNGSIENAFTYSLVSDAVAEVTFEMHSYKIKIGEFEGGAAVASPSTVVWGRSAQLSLSLNKGYVLTGVTINGNESAEAYTNLSSGRTYTILDVRADTTVILKVEKKGYDVTFGGDYARTYNVTDGNGKTLELTAVAGAVINENVYNAERRDFYSDKGGMDASGSIIRNDADGNYIGLRYSEKLSFRLIPPEGYYITSVTITMDDDGKNAVTLVSGESGLDVDDGSGIRTYTIDNVTGNVTVYVTYAIKQYRVTYSSSIGGVYMENTATTLSYYEAIGVELLSNKGYYLRSLTINGQTVGTFSAQDGASYRYKTDNDAGVKLLVNDALVNNRSEIIVTPIFERQYFNVIFYVNNEMAVSSGDMLYANNLGLALENNKITYDESIPAIVYQTLAEGYSITGVKLCNTVGASDKDSIVLASGSGVNQYGSKSETLNLLLTDEILSYMNFESVDRNTLRIYYTVTRDAHVGQLVNYLVTADGGSNAGSEIGFEYDGDSDGRSDFYIDPYYSDNVAGTDVKHEYGTKATFTAAVTAYGENRYSFEGFQEKINGEWVYVRDGVNGISLLSDGWVMEYTMQSDREFRAVFFRLYEITVEIHPEYKYYRGSFISYDPSQMLYRLYSDMSAEAVYAATSDVPLPNIVGDRETIVNSDTNVNDAVYVYYVRSGANLYLRGADRYTENATQGFNFSYVEYDSNGIRKFTTATYATGVATMQDRLVYAYARNSMYVSMEMETIGSLTPSSGGTMSYAVDGATVTSLRDNSLIMEAGRRLEINIVPNSGYRFESVAYLVPLSTPDANGYRQFSDRYEVYAATADGSVEIEYFDESGKLIDPTAVSSYTGRFSRVRLILNALDENTIIKVTFRKQITLSASISVVTDEGSVEPGYMLEFDDRYSTADGVYDYNDVVEFVINETLTMQSGWEKYYQFVGYFINGVNSYKQLGQYYPADTSGMFVLNDLDGLADGVNIVEKKTGSGSTVTTEYIVDIVARFIPVYNVVVENEYIDEGVYHDTGSVVATTASYNPDMPQYFTSSYNVTAVTSATSHTDKSFSMLGKINSIATTGISSATSPYNVWSDNKLSLYWESSSSTFRFLYWQYWAYDASTGTFAWKNIPYSDPSDPTNLVTRSSFSFPISCLFDTTYTAYVGRNGELDNGFKHTVSVYDAAGNYLYDETIGCIRIRPVYQKVESLNLVKSTATDSANIFVDGEGAVEPKIAATSMSYGNFNYGTVQTLLPSLISGYEFAGWYIVDNGGAGGRQALNLTSSDTGLSDRVIDGITFVGDYIQNADGSDTSDTIYYNYDANTGTMLLIMDGSYTIYARYIRIYRITLEVSSLSGTAPGLMAALPYLKYYVEDGSGGWTQVTGAGYEDERTIIIEDAKVGNKIMIMLETGYTGKVDDLNHFNPRFDRYSGVTVYDDNNNDIFMTGGDYELSKEGLPTALDPENPDDYNDKIENMYVVISANRNKRVSINFSAYGELEIHNIYWGSAVKLPEALADALGNGNSEDGLGGKYISDGGLADGDGVKNGVIVIKNIPILRGAVYDGQVAGDFGNRLLISYGPLESSYINYGINFNGSSESLSKWQKIVYYGSKELTQYVWNAENKQFEAVTVSESGQTEYPFYGGDGESAGDGSSGKPFLIATVGQLRNIDALYRGCNAELGGIYFRVVADIDLSEVGNALNAPLCAPYVDANGVSRSGGFNGIFDGDGYTLSNLYLDMSATSNVGLFSSTATGAVIRNVVIKGAYVYGSVNVGVLVGEAVNAVIENIKVVNGVNSSVSGNNNVGGIVGYARADRNVTTEIRDVSVTNFTVSASAGASYDEAGGFLGGAGGIIGQIGLNAYVTSSAAVNLDAPASSGTYTSGVNVSSAIGAGGIAGTITGDSAADGGSNAVAIINAVAIDPVLSSYNNGVAIGGLAGAIGQSRFVEDSYLALSKDATIYSASALGTTAANFKEPNSNNIYLLGAGGIAGHNMGTIRGSSVVNLYSGNYKLIFTGSLIGGLVGVNFGSIEDSSSSVRMLSSRASAASSYAGGSYGGIAGVNWSGTILNCSFTVDMTGVNNDYATDSSAIEIVTNQAQPTYTPAAKGNAPMHDPTVASDGTTVYIGGIAGYNAATINGGSFSGKLMFNRRSSDAQSNNTYIAAGVGFNAAGATVSDFSSSDSILKLFHYVYVDQAGDDKMFAQYAYIGGAFGKNSGTATNNTVSVAAATAEYCGGGTKYNQASVSAGFTWTFYADGYMSGSAQVSFSEISGSAWSVVPRDINGENIKTLRDDGAVYSGDCEETGGDIGLIWKTAWNYTGYLRYIAVSEV